jgi:hypothetical protein
MRCRGDVHPRIEMNDFLIGVAGHLAGLDDATIIRLENDIPYIRQLVGIAKKAQPIIQQAEPLINQARGLWSKIAPDIDTVLSKLENKA